MIVTNRFIKTLPQGDRKKILRKLDIFEKHLLEAENKIRELPAGYYVRCIKNTDIFKFRLNNKDRILYTYIKQRDKESSQIVFLQYVTHDEQERVAHNIHTDSINEVSLDIDISREAYVEKKDEKTVDEYMTQYCRNGFIDMDLVPSIVVSEEKLAQLADANDEEYLYYLSKEQYDIISTLKGRVLLTGAGGTGKTVVLHNALAYAKENNQRALYVTYNELLLDSTRKVYEKFVDEKLENCDFYTVRQLEIKCYGESENRVITHEELIQWVKENKDKFKKLRERDTFETAVELNGVLLGSMGQLEMKSSEEENKGLRGDYVGTLEFQQYLKCTKSDYSFKEDKRRDIFNLGKAYIKWLKENNLTDENQLIEKIFKDKNCSKTYDWVIVDEVQDLSEKQIHFLNEFVKDSGYIIWAGDVNQVILPTIFSYSSIKSMYFNIGEDLAEFSMSRNYRSTTGIVDFINDIARERMKILGKTSYDYQQQAIRKGDKPYVLRFQQEDMHRLLQSIGEKHYCALVVPNEDMKNSLIKKYSEAASRIFTIYEIKGLEYENIICYNIISAYKNLWEEMLSGNEKAREAMRYYFNMIYVASSRAKDNLNIYEDSMENLKFKPYEGCRELKEFNEQELGLLKTSSSADWQQEADRLEKAGQAVRAKLIRNFKLEETLESINKRADELYSKMYKGISKQVQVKTPLDEAMKPGILLYRQRNYTGALEIFNSLLEKYPEESDLYYYMANCYGYMSMGRTYSYRYFWHAIKINPYNYKCYLDMAAVLNSERNYKEALDILEVADKIIPQYGNAYEIMGSVYASMGDMSKAMKFMNKSMKLPRFHFDEYNKIWVSPKHPVVAEAKEKSQEGTAEVKDNSNSLQLPDGVEFIKAETNGTIKECINEITFKEVKYNKANKRYNFVFDRELCSICEDQEKCIFKKADKYDKASVKEVVIKKLIKLVKEKEVDVKAKMEEKAKESHKEVYAEELIEKLNEKYGDNFDNFDNKELHIPNTGVFQDEGLRQLWDEESHYWRKMNDKDSEYIKDKREALLNYCIEKNQLYIKDDEYLNNTVRRKREIINEVNDENKIAKYIETFVFGNQYMDKKYYLKASEEFERAINILPNMRNAYIKLSQCYIALGRFEKAIELLKKVKCYEFVDFKDKYNYRIIKGGSKEDKFLEEINKLIEGYSEMIMEDIDDSELSEFINYCLNMALKDYDIHLDIQYRSNLIMNMNIENVIIKIEGYKEIRGKRLKEFFGLLKEKRIPCKKEIESIFISIEEDVDYEVIMNRINKYKNRIDESIYEEYFIHYLIYTVVLTRSMRFIAECRNLKNVIYKKDPNKIMEIYINEVNNLAKKMLSSLNI